VCGKRARLSKRSGAATTAPLPRLGPVIRTLPHHQTHRQAAAHPRPRHTSYQVQSGDTLSGIAERLGVHGGWHVLWELNRSHVPNPNVIFVGQLLRIS
jgi:nucleoid-associated protein YgaU